MRLEPLLVLGVIAGCGLPLAGLGETAPDGGAAVDASLESAEGDDGDGDAIDTATSPPADVATDQGAGGDTGPSAEASTDGGPGTSNDAGGALQFSGGAYVAIGQLPIPADFTLEAWVRPSSTSGETCILAEDRNGQGAGQFRLGIASGQLFFLMSDATGNTGGLYGTGYALESPSTLPLATWTHVAVAKGGTAFTLFVNGAQVAQFNTAGAPLVYGGPAVAFRIAARVASNGTSADEAYDGTIDEVRFWNLARSGAEIGANMSLTVLPTDPGLLAYWRFDDGAGLTASDKENHYPGTLVDGPVWVVSTAF